jgi:hypothetical protein
MSNYTQKEGQGSLFRNDKKNNEKSPEYTGSIMVNGKEMRLSAWVKEGKIGKFLSLQISEKQNPKPATESASNNDLPF